MKRFAIAAALVPGLAFATIMSSRHNLSASGPAFSNGNTQTKTGNQVCVFCHTPHRPNQQLGIWNHVNSATTDGFGPGNVTLQGTTYPTTFAAGSWTKRCLDCHDGSVNLGALAWVNGAPSTGYGGLNVPLSTANYTERAGVLALHPVDMPYTGQSGSSAQSSGYYPVNANGTVGSSFLRLFKTGGTGDYKMQCVTCHDAHSTTFSYFLQDNIQASALCFDCHIK